MKLFKSLKICFTAVLLSTPFFSLAQYKFEIKPFFSYFRDLSRWEIGGTGLLASGSFDGVTRITGYNNTYYIGDSTLKRGLTSKPSFGGSIGIAVPFAAAGHISVWALSMHAMVNQYSWSDLNQTKGLDGTYTVNPIPLSATTMQIAVPIGIDYKIGCDAIATRRLMFGGALGAGVMPHINITSLEPSAAGDVEQPQQAIGFNPYVKAEGSIFPGMCVKLRVLYTMGNIELVNTKNAIPNYTDGPFKMYNKSSLMVSLLIMPFSTRWKETAWWNTRDSYNWNERLN
jgi:hypothetical protein